MRKKRFIANVFIMSSSMLVIRVLGMGANIYISRKLGAWSMGLYHMIMSVFTFGITFACSGAGFAVTRLVSEEKSNETDIIKKALLITAVMSAVGVCVFYIGAPFIESRFIKHKEARYALKAICTALPFMSASSVFRGYFIAKRKAGIITISSLIEECVCLGVTLLCLTKYKGLENAYMCLVWGCIASNFVAFITDSIFCRACIKNGVSILPKTKFKDILAICVPIALGSYLRTGLVSLENLVIPISFQSFGIADSVGEYGSIKAMAMSVVLFPTVFIQAFSSMLVPEMSELNSKSHKNNIRYISSLAISAIMIFSSYIALMLFKHHEIIANSLFKEPRVSYYLGLLSLLAVPMYLDTVADSILKGLNLQNASLKYNTIDSGLRVLSILWLMPKYGPVFYIAMLYISEIFNLSLSLGKAAKVTGLKINITETIILPLCCVLCAGVFKQPITQTAIYWGTYFVLKRIFRSQHI